MSFDRSTSDVPRSIPLLAAVLFAPLMAAAVPAAAQTTPLAGSPAASQARPAPAINRINEHLPRWLRVRGEWRGRLEGFDGAAFTPDREDLYWLNRFRFNVGVTPLRHLAFQTQVQDARVARKQIGPTGAPFRAPFDLRLAYADIGAANAPATLRLGRQELAFGEQRLVGHVSWLNAARVFDGGRVTLRRPGLTVDGFATAVVQTAVDAFDRPQRGNRFLGAYAATTRLIPRSSLEPYVFWRRDRDVRSESGALGTLSQTTIGVRWAGTAGSGFDYGVETAVQTGSAGSDDIRAWASHHQIRTPARGGLRWIGEYNVASGDRDPADGRRETFDQLYPTPHDKYGLADQIGWRNVHHLRAGVELGRWRTLPITANYHSWWLVEPRDGAYAAGGALVARLPAGAPDRHIGQEVDVQVSRAITPQLQVAAGYAHLFTGAFLDAATPGASYSHPYVMATWVFLADR
jgi:hypothetical protein